MFYLLWLSFSKYKKNNVRRYLHKGIAVEWLNHWVLLNSLQSYTQGPLLMYFILNSECAGKKLLTGRIVFCRILTCFRFWTIFSKYFGDTYNKHVWIFLGRWCYNQYTCLCGNTCITIYFFNRMTGPEDLFVFLKKTRHTCFELRDFCKSYSRDSVLLWYNLGIHPTNLILAGREHIKLYVLSVWQ